MRWASVLFGAVLFSVIAARGEDSPFPMPRPTKEHEYLKQFVGHWDCEVKFYAEPGKPPSVSKGEEHAHLSNGLWLVFGFKGTMFGQEFNGHGLLGFDPKKQKYTSAWADTISTTLELGEGTVDKDGKVFTFISETESPDGKKMKTKQVSTVIDNDHKKSEFSLVGVGEGGKDYLMMTIEYTRKKPQPKPSGVAE